MAPPTSPPTPEPQTHLDGLLDAELSGSSSCLLVLEDGKPVAAYRPDDPVIPASTQKVLTGAAALEAFGPDHRFRTSVAASDDISDGVATHLWLIGGGDPALSTGSYATYIRNNPRFASLPPTSVEQLADQLVAKGLREVKGAVHADGSRTASGYEPGWDRYLGKGNITPLSALNLDQGWQAWIPGRVASPDPAKRSADVFVQLLRERGVTVRTAARGPAPAEAPRVAEIASAPLSELVRGMLHASDNVSAEMLTRELGLHRSAQGTTPAGASAIADTLGSLGVRTEGVAPADGSGLERRNLLTCRSLVDTLRSSPGGVDLPGLLPTAARTGTLHHRYHGTPAAGRLHGKTGWIYGVVGLTGTVDGPRPLTFALVQNGEMTLAEGRAKEARLTDIMLRYASGEI